MPHQVLSEFWRNRDLPSVRGHHRTKAKDACAALDKAQRALSDALDRWLKEVHLSNDKGVKEQIDSNKEGVGNILTNLKSLIQAQADKDALKETLTTQSDPVLTKLDGLLRGRIGEPFPEATLAAALQEAKKRSDKRIPPGHEDFKDKPVDQAAGDYLLWAQLLDEAERRRSDVLLVTGDVKVDWWIPGTHQVPPRPRTELITELRNRAAVQLYMLTPSQLLTQANEIFNLRVDERSVSDLATAEITQGDPRKYSRTIELMLRQQFPEVQILSLEEQLDRSAPTPIPDLTFLHPNCKIGIEVKTTQRYVGARHLQYVEEMIDTHGLQAVIVVSNTHLSPAATRHLEYVGRESSAWVAGVRIDEEYVTESEGQAVLKYAIKDALSACAVSRGSR